MARDFEGEGELWVHYQDHDGQLGKGFSFGSLMLVMASWDSPFHLVMWCGVWEM
jgi:hypothetical protein